MTGNVEFRQAEATEFQNFLKSNASFIMNNINMVSQSVESLKSTYKTSETESIFNEVERGLKKFENDYNTINQKYYDTLEKVKLNYQLAESQNSAVFTDVGSNMHAASLALGSGAMTAAGFDFGKISTNAQDATSGKFVNKVDVSAFNEKSDYTFTYRKDGSVLVSKNGTAIGYTTVENANKVTGGKFVGNTNPSNNYAGGNDNDRFNNSTNLTNQGYPNSASEQTTTGGTNNVNATNNYAGGNDSDRFNNSTNLTNQGYPNSVSEQTTTGGTNNVNATNNYAGGNDSDRFNNSTNLTNQGYPNSVSEQTTTGGINNVNATNNYAGGDNSNRFNNYSNLVDQGFETATEIPNKYHGLSEKFTASNGLKPNDTYPSINEWKENN